MTSLFPNGYLVESTDEILPNFDNVSAQAFPFFDLWGNACENEAYLKMTHDGVYLYCFFRCYFREKPQDVTAIHGKKVYRDECVELFIGSKNNYFEFDVSPYNMQFFVLVDNKGEPEPAFSEVVGDFSTATVMQDSFYEASYKISLKELLRFGKKLYINAFRVEMKNGERVSRTISKTNSNLHHVPEAFISIRFS